MDACHPRREKLELDDGDWSLTRHDPSSGGSLLSGPVLSSQWLTVFWWLRCIRPQVLQMPPAVNVLTVGILTGPCCKQLMQTADSSRTHDAAVQLLA